MQASQAQEQSGDNGNGTDARAQRSQNIAPVSCGAAAAAPHDTGLIKQSPWTDAGFGAHQKQRVRQLSLSGPFKTTIAYCAAVTLAKLPHRKVTNMKITKTCARIEGFGSSTVPEKQMESSIDGAIDRAMERYAAGDQTNASKTMVSALNEAKRLTNQSRDGVFARLHRGFTVSQAVLMFHDMAALRAMREVSPGLPSMAYNAAICEFGDGLAHEVNAAPIESYTTKQIIALQNPKMAGVLWGALVAKGEVFGFPMHMRLQENTINAATLMGAFKGAFGHADKIAPPVIDLLQ